jgi:hypothetical protein
VVADQAILTDAYAQNYAANLAPFVAGLCSTLDEKVALTNQSTSLTQLPGLVYTPGQLDALTQGKINILRYKGTNAQPALLHDQTAATVLSDYTEVLRMRIKGLVVSTMLAIGDPFIGSSSLDGLQMTSLQTALDNGLSELSRRGYIANPNVQISRTRSLRPVEPKLLARAREAAAPPAGRSVSLRRKLPSIFERRVPLRLPDIESRGNAFSLCRPRALVRYASFFSPSGLPGSHLRNGELSLSPAHETPPVTHRNRILSTSRILLSRHSERARFPWHGSGDSSDLLPVTEDRLSVFTLTLSGRVNASVKLPLIRQKAIALRVGDRRGRGSVFSLPTLDT